MNKKAVGALVTYVGIMVGGMLVIKVLVRAMDGPDFGTTLKMRGWSGVRAASYRQAEFWGRMGMRAEMLYDKCRG